MKLIWTWQLELSLPPRTETAQWLQVLQEGTTKNMFKQYENKAYTISEARPKTMRYMVEYSTFSGWHIYQLQEIKGVPFFIPVGEVQVQEVSS